MTRERCETLDEQALVRWIPQVIRFDRLNLRAFHSNRLACECRLSRQTLSLPRSPED
jgi:hypothetical protein